MAAPVASLAPNDAQPRTISLTLRALLALPFRLCNPPPAVGKVRSCQMTPVYRVTLEDVLNRRHLPPLGLKDFEEWLLFVEGNPENLYFILWLKEYAARYNRWASQSRPVKPSDRFQSSEDYQCSTQALPSNQLAHFYLRAKQTFFTPGAEFELNVPSDVLSPFHTGHFVSPHPDPLVFAAVTAEVHRMLKQSLDRFVLAQYSNVGSTRAICGVIGGIVIGLTGTVPPLVVNFMHDRSRWLRLFALPGLWLGLTIILSALHGVCMMVYIFGDLRQLHKFELLRPQISAPRPLGFNERAIAPVPVAYKGDTSSTSILPPYDFVRPRSAPPQRPVLAPITIPEAARTRTPIRMLSPSSSSLDTPYDRSSRDSSSSSLSVDTADADLDEITMSPVYHEEPAPEGPNTRTRPWTPPTMQQLLQPKAEWRSADHTAECNAHRIHSTARFIHAFDDSPHDTEAGSGHVVSAAYGLEDDVPFDFDALPARVDDAPCICGGLDPALASSVALPDEALNEKAGWDRQQDKQEQRRVSTMRDPMTPTRYRMEPPPMPPAHGPAPRPYCQHGKPDVVSSDMARQRRWAWVRKVPAFGPLTRVLSPVISRAQWEIVVRSWFLAGIISGVVIGVLVSVPIMR